MVAIHSDVTNYKNREVELWAAKEKAEIANRSKSEFLANMSHELRTPLNAIIGFSDIFKAETFGPLGDSSYSGYAEDINKSGYHLLDVVDDILDVSAIEDGKLTVMDNDVDIAKSAKSVIQLVNQARNSKGITINNQINDNLPKIIGDERRIKQIFINLLSNAVKFTDHDGTVDLNATLQGDGGMQIKITDSGIGMDEKGIEIALTKFGQIDGELTREQEGTGLGLPLTKGLVEAHGGTLTIDSKLGIGTTVNVCLPKERVV
jgi:signal transduction histidine kinase